MKNGFVIGEIGLLVFFLYKGLNTNNSASYVFFGLAGLMAILIIGTLVGFDKK